MEVNMDKNIRKEIKEYIEKEIFEEYKLNERGHGINHIKYVIRRSLQFAETIENINFEMVYVIAAYHDIGHHIDAQNHEIISAQKLFEDKKIKEFFNEEQIIVMKEAIEDHRASKDTDPRTIYGRIVSSADRNIDIEFTLKRCYSYRINHSPELNQDEIIEVCRKFLIEKFGINGYARNKMYFDDKEYSKYLHDITELAINKEKFYEEIIRVNS